MGNKVKLNIFSFGAVFLWAAAFPLTKIAGAVFTPYCLGLIRCTVAAAALLLVGRFLKVRTPWRKRAEDAKDVSDINREFGNGESTLDVMGNGELGNEKGTLNHNDNGTLENGPVTGSFRTSVLWDILLLVLAGITGFALYLIFFNTGITTITSATSSIIVASTPIMTAIVCSKLYEEKINTFGWVAICLAFAGVMILLLWNGMLSINIGVVWTLGAAVVFCLYNLLNRKLASLGYTSVEIVTYGMISAALFMMFSLPSAVDELGMSTTDMPVAIVVAVCLGLLPSATSYVLWAKAIELADKTNEVTNYMFITPLLSTVMGFFMLGEVPDVGTFIGGGIIITGVVLFGIKGK